MFSESQIECDIIAFFQETMAAFKFMLKFHSLCQFLDYLLSDEDITDSQKHKLILYKNSLQISYHLPRDFELKIEWTDPISYTKLGLCHLSSKQVQRVTEENNNYE